MAIRGLIIAIENYDPKGTLSPIKGGNAEAQKFFEWLTNIKGAKPRDCFVCVDGGAFNCANIYPTFYSGLIRAIVDLIQAGQDKTDELYVFFAGHGCCIQDSGGQRGWEILMAADFSDLLLGPRCCIDLAQLREKLYSKLGGRNHYYFVDACRNVFTHDQWPDVFPLGLNAIMPARKGNPDKYTLFSTAFGQIAPNNLSFGSALDEGLRGHGRAKGFNPAGELFVKFDLLHTYLENQLGRPLDAPTDGGDGLILQIQPIPQYKCDIEVRNAAPHDQFEYRYALASNPALASKGSFVGSRTSFHFTPGDYSLLVFEQQQLLVRVDPPPEVLIDFFDDCQAMFEKPVPAPTPPPPAQTATPAQVTVINARSELEFTARNIASGIEHTLRPYFPVALNPGRYEFTAGLGNHKIFREVQSMQHGDDLKLEFSVPFDDVRSSIVQAIGQDPSFRVVNFSESLGETIDSDLALWLSILGASRVLADTTIFHKIEDLSLDRFEDMRPNESRVYVLAALPEGGRVNLALGDAWKDVAEVVDLKHIYQASFDAAIGTHVFSYVLGDKESRSVAVCCLPNRVSLIVLAPDDHGRHRLLQFALPVFHLRAYMPDVVRHQLGSLEAKLPPLRFMQSMYILQNQFTQGKRLQPPTPDEINLWNEMLHAKWMDPVMSLIACYDILRRGDASQKDWLREEVIPNLRQFFPETPDTEAIAKFLDMDSTIPDDPPLFKEALLLAPAWLDKLPYEESKLDYNSPWTMWVGAVAAPGKRSRPLVLQTM